MFQKNAAILGVVLALSAATISQAVPTLKITDGTTTVLVGDGSASDGAIGSAGIVTWNNLSLSTFAGWSIIVTAGTTKPAVGSATSPQLDLNWVVLRTGPAVSSTLSISFSETDFNLGANTAASTSTGGTLGTLGANTATVSTFYSAANTLFSGTLLTTHGFVGPGAIGANDAGVIPALNPVALTIQLDLTQPVFGEITSGDIHLKSVPEGGSMVTLLGTALLALGAFAARRKA